VLKGQVDSNMSSQLQDFISLYLKTMTDFNWKNIRLALLSIVVATLGYTCTSAFSSALSISYQSLYSFFTTLQGGGIGFYVSLGVFTGIIGIIIAIKTGLINDLVGGAIQA
jgi:hypothetical protein